MHSTGVKGSGCACNNNIKRMYWDCQRLVPICGMCIVENVGVEASNVKPLTLYNSVICVDCQRLVLVVALNYILTGKQCENAVRMERLDTIRLPALSLNQFPLHRAYFTVKVGL